VHQISKIYNNLSFDWVSLAGGLLSKFHFLCLLVLRPDPTGWTAAVRPDPTGWTGAGPDKGTARQAADRFNRIFLDSADGAGPSGYGPAGHRYGGGHRYAAGAGGAGPSGYGP
jgi:hypothetical protein